MRRFLFLLLTSLLLSSAALRAQTITTAAEFDAYAKSWSQALQPLRAAKQYRPLLARYAEMHQVYDALPPATKPGFRHLPANLYYNEACYHALLQERAEALRCFRQAIASGYSDYYNAKSDSDLDLLRGDRAFEQQLAALRAKGDYLYVLQQAQGYRAQSEAGLPAFRYQSPQEPHLTARRQHYRLDSVAG